METLFRLLIDPLLVWTLLFNAFFFVLLKYIPKYFQITLISFLLLTAGFTNPWLAERATRQLESYGIENSELGTASQRSRLDCNKYAGVIALGGVISNRDFNQEQGIQLLSSAERITEPVALKVRCPEFKVIYSSFGPDLNEEVGESELARDFWISLGIPASDIYIENVSTNTRENALFVRDLLVKKKLKNEKWLLVTSAIHMKRAHLAFAKLDLQTIPIPVDFLWATPPSPLDFNPVAAIENWRKYFHEFLGITYYRFNSWN